jgi:hypothetical protein
VGIWEVQRLVCVATRPRAGPLEARAVAVPPTASRPALGPTQSQLIGYRGLFPSGLKRPGREVYC